MCVARRFAPFSGGSQIRVFASWGGAVATCDRPLNGWGAGWGDSMKIIAGEFGGRTILGPRDASTTRPITGRVRTSVFDRLATRGLLDGEPVLDVFAGTGTLGIEAISRGASACLFIEQNRAALHRLERNLETLELSDRGEARAADALRLTWLDHLPRPFSEGVSVTFVDPPYALWARAEGRDRLAGLIAAVARRTMPAGALVLRMPKEVDAPVVAGWGEPERIVYGSQAVAMYERGA